MNRKKWFVCLLLGAMMLTTAAHADDEHPFGPWITKTSATCTRQGHDFRYCRNCDHWEQRYTKKLPHTPDEWKVTKEPTCTEEGVMNAKCTVCGGSLRKTIDKLGHDWKVTNVIKEPTCHKEGRGEMVCQRCGKTMTGPIDHLDHQWGEWTVIKEPVGNKMGERKHTCLLCGDTVTARFYTEGTLYEDMEPSEEVIRMQIMLRDMGYYNGKINSGKFGGLTGKAVNHFRLDNDLPSATVADPETQQMITEKWEAETGKLASEINIQMGSK